MTADNWYAAYSRQELIAISGFDGSTSDKEFDKIIVSETNKIKQNNAIVSGVKEFWAEIREELFRELVAEEMGFDRTWLQG